MLIYLSYISTKIRDCFPQALNPPGEAAWAGLPTPPWGEFQQDSTTSACHIEVLCCWGYDVNTLSLGHCLSFVCACVSCHTEIFDFYTIKFQGFFKKRFYLFLEKRGRETSMCDCLLYTPNWRPGPQPWNVPWLGIELTILWFAGQYSIHWATPGRAKSQGF